MKQKAKLFVILSSFCFVLAIGLLGVFSAEKFNWDMEGTIDFYGTDVIQTSFDFTTPDVAQATISEATLSGINKKDAENMQSFGVSSGTTDSSVQTWKNSALVFDENSTIPNQATISFTITNTSQTTGENIMVKLSSNTTNTSPVQATPSADFCISPGNSHTFTVNLFFENIENATYLNNIELSLELEGLNTSEIPLISSLQTDGFSFSTNSTTQTAIFTQYSGTATSVVIPAVIKDASGNVYTVTETLGGDEVGDSVFDNVQDNDVTSVTLPSTLTKIGSFSFDRCTALSGELVIPNGVTEIGHHAFGSCSGLTGNLIIPNSVTFINYYAFSGCSGLTGDLIIPNSVTTINDGAFSSCSGFDSLSIGSNVAHIYNSIRGAFDYCDFETIEVSAENATYYSKNNCVISKQDKMIVVGCKNSIIPQNEDVLIIDNYVFYGCKNLTSITILATTPPSIYSNTFSNSGIVNIYVPEESVEAYKTATYWSTYADKITAIG